MRRAALALLLLACAAAGVLAALALPRAGTAASSTTGTEPPPTTTGVEPTTPQPEALIPAGVRVGGVRVGGLTRDAALAVVRTSFSRPLVLSYRSKRLRARPQSLRTVAYAQGAVRRAALASPGTRVPLVVRVDGRAVRRFVARVAARFDQKPLDAKVSLRKVRPVVTRDRIGLALDRRRAIRMIVRALATNRRTPLVLPVRIVRPKATRADFGPIVVIRRASNRLFLYNSWRFVRMFRVATGQAAYPTPLGDFEVIVKWANPWWYPPDSDWARGLLPVPPGPGNPLGTRWMGISSPGVGMHGTPNPASLGYSASHGCIRLAIPEAEWLFERVEVGTPVFIVDA